MVKNTHSVVEHQKHSTEAVSEGSSAASPTSEETDMFGKAKYVGAHRAPESDTTSINVSEVVKSRWTRRILVPVSAVLAMVLGFGSAAFAKPVHVVKGDTFSALVYKHCGTRDWQSVSFPGRNKNLIYADETIDITCPGSTSTKSNSSTSPSPAPAQKAPVSSNGWVNPVPGACAGSGFGWRSGRVHQGVDLKVSNGTPVYAAHAGTVHWGNDPDGAGWYIILNNGGGVWTTYFHLSKRTAPEGSYVQAGQVIGLSGGIKGAAGAGNSTGPHLHFEVHPWGGAWTKRYNSSLGANAYVNPVTWMADHGVHLGC